MAKRIAKTGKAKGKKPATVWAHPSGYWCRKLRQTCHYFGAVKDDPDGTKANAEMGRQWPYIVQGLTPPPADAGEHCTLLRLCDAFLEAKRSRVASGELSPRTWANYKATCDMLLAHFGPHRRVDDLRPDDFDRLRAAMAERWTVNSLRREITFARVLLGWAYTERMIDRPVHFGQAFDKPAAGAVRKARNAHGPRLYTADELRRIIDAADPTMKAAVLLGINCGFGNVDCSDLPIEALDLDGGWMTFPRPKTHVPRRCKLWTETVDALRAALASRPKPKSKSDAACVLLTPRGGRLVRTYATKGGSYARDDRLSPRFRKLLDSLGINSGRTFYDLRRTFQTIADGAKDPVATSAVMGHSDQSMAAVYRQGIADDRLADVAAHVRAWLPEPAAEA